MKVNCKKDPVIPNLELEAQAESVADQQAKDHANAQKISEALVKQPADLPVLTTVKGRDGQDKLAARIKGKFANTANARVLAVQKSVEKVMHKPDETGTTQLERIITAQAKVAEGNTDARNLGGISKFLEHADEISGTKDARKALTKEVNTPLIPLVIISMPDLIHKEIIDFEKQQREDAERIRKGPSFADSTVIQQNPPNFRDKA